MNILKVEKRRMVHKLYIDSRKRIRGTSSCFAYQLVRPIEVPASRVFVDSVSLPNSFPSVHAGNRSVYIEERVGNSDFKRKVALTEGFYDGFSLAEEVQTRINSGTNLAVPYTVTFEEKTGKLKISNTGVFSVWPDEALAKGQWDPRLGAGIPLYEQDSANEVLGYYGKDAIQGTDAISNGHVSLMPYHSLFLHSDLGTQGDSMGPSGEQSIIRRVVLDQPPGAMIHDFHSLPHDFVSVPRGNIRTINFKITNYEGKEVDMSHMNISFSLIFLDAEEF